MTVRLVAHSFWRWSDVGRPTLPMTKPTSFVLASFGTRLMKDAESLDLCHPDGARLCTCALPGRPDRRKLCSIQTTSRSGRFKELPRTMTDFRRCPCRGDTTFVRGIHLRPSVSGSVRRKKRPGEYSLRHARSMISSAVVRKNLVRLADRESPRSTPRPPGISQPVIGKRPVRRERLERTGHARDPSAASGFGGRTNRAPHRAPNEAPMEPTPSPRRRPHRAGIEPQREPLMELTSSRSRAPHRTETGLHEAAS